MALMRYSRRDWLCAAAIALLVLAVGACGLTTGLPYWGDDHAAYISEGIAIAEGRLAEQARLNYALHPSPLPDEAGEEGLVYVWGYPLMLSAVYRAVGFDREDFSEVIWYKLPLLFSYALTAGALFLFMRRRFSLGWAAFIALLFCANRGLCSELNQLYSDLPFLLFSVLTLLLAEVFAAHVSDRGWGVVCAAAYGASMWFTRELRLNGTALCLAALLGHVLCAVKGRVAFNRKNLWLHLLPYLLAALMSLVSERLLLMPATSNLSDVGRGGIGQALRGVRFYGGKLYTYLDGLPVVRPRVLGAALALLCAVGIVARGLRDNLHLTALLVGTLAVDVALPYYQELRYVYNVLPVLLMFVAYGGRCALGRVRAKLAPAGRRPLHIAVCAIAVAVLCANYASLAGWDLYNLRHWGEKSATDVYSEDAVSAYRYIRENVGEDEVVAFFKPRALCLNTGRLSVRPNVNGHTLDDADYYLYYKFQAGEYYVAEAETAPMEALYENDTFLLSRIIH